MARYGADFGFGAAYDVDFDTRGVPIEPPGIERRRDFFRGGDGDYGTTRRLHRPPGYPVERRYRGRRSGDLYSGGRGYSGWRMGTRSDWSHEPEIGYEDRVFGGRMRPRQPPRPESRGYDRGW